MKTVSMLLGAALVAAAASAVAGGHDMDMKAMDTNGDGMISKDEFMKYHQMKWDKMKKNSAGMVDMKDMGMMHDKMHDTMHDKMHDKMKPADKAKQ